MPNLSQAEQRVYDLALQGLSYSDIGKQLWLSPQTVMKHLVHIRKKVDLPRQSVIRRSPELYEKFGYRLGSLCLREHRYNGTDQSLRNFAGLCVECDRVYKLEARKRVINQC